MIGFEKEPKGCGPFPAFHTFDANENFIGLTVCTSGKWGPPYKFYPCSQEDVHDFQWGHWTTVWGMEERPEEYVNQEVYDADGNLIGVEIAADHAKHGSVSYSMSDSDDSCLVDAPWWEKDFCHDEYIEKSADLWICGYRFSPLSNAYFDYKSHFNSVLQLGGQNYYTHPSWTETESQYGDFILLGITPQIAYDTDPNIEPEGATWFNRRCESTEPIVVGPECGCNYFSNYMEEHLQASIDETPINPHENRAWTAEIYYNISGGYPVFVDRAMSFDENNEGVFVWGHHEQGVSGLLYSASREWEYSEFHGDEIRNRKTESTHVTNNVTFADYIHVFGKLYEMRRWSITTDDHWVYYGGAVESGDIGGQWAENVMPRIYTLPNDERFALVSMTRAAEAGVPDDVVYMAFAPDRDLKQLEDALEFPVNHSPAWNRYYHLIDTVEIDGEMVELYGNGTFTLLGGSVPSLSEEE